MRSLVMDLRGNPGGVLAQGVGVADMFLDSTRVDRVDAWTQPGRHRTSDAMRRRSRGRTFRWSCWSMPAAPAPRKSSPAPCRTTIARWSSGARRSGREARRGFSRRRQAAACGSRRRAGSRLPVDPSTGRMSTRRCSKKTRRSTASARNMGGASPAAAGSFRTSSPATRPSRPAIRRSRMRWAIASTSSATRWSMWRSR